MTHNDSRTRHATEQHELRHAMQRLLTGIPERSNGRLNVSTLATESGIARHRLYEHHADIVTEFKTAAGGGPITPNIQALQRQLAESQQQVHHLESVNRRLLARIHTLSAVIVENSLQSHGGAIVAMPTRRRETTRPPG